MLNWIAVLKRMLHLYGVRDQRELSLALGAPVDVEMEKGVAEAIPWPILEAAVAGKNVSWDWLLTGRGLPGDPPAREDAAPDEASPDAPRTEPVADGEDGRLRLAAGGVETRELERRLLGHPASPGGGDFAAFGDVSPPAALGAGEAAILADIEFGLRRELERLGSLLDERKKRT